MVDTLNYVLVQLNDSEADLDATVQSTRITAEEHLHTAQELSLLRHSLADELSFLSEQLVSSMSSSYGRPTLLEEIETMHRGLKELESIKGYVQVAQQALRLRYVNVILPGVVLRLTYSSVRRLSLKHLKQIHRCPLCLTMSNWNDLSVRSPKAAPLSRMHLDSRNYI